MTLDTFKDKTAVITGAASGIGLALAQALARQGAHLMLADLDAENLNSAVHPLRALGVRVEAMTVDVSRREEVLRLGDQAFRHFGQVHLLCNNAGVATGGPLHTARTEDWQWVLGVNLWGVIHGIEAFASRMVAQGVPAHVVNTASMAGLIASRDLGIYNASKAAVVSLSETLARDLKETSVGVSVLCPMGVKTRIIDSERNRPEWAPRSGAANAPPPLVGRWLDPDGVAERVLEAVRVGELFILTHHEGREFWERRAARITQGFPPPPRE
ncbi:MAG: SDR family NAD(P)-dependent oxidoreductase [Deltaproteobacteria bacterium]|nr:SDR family NAD(P)-dependent oxidoreductase [Deltaproteobacteria bacterium]